MCSSNPDRSTRTCAARPAPAAPATGFAFARTRGPTTAVHRCVGVGKCRADESSAGGFMCPCYLATQDEKDSTRGRARVLQEMADRTLVSSGWSSPEVAEALDLCLGCKACSSDCPAGVDMARSESEVLTVVSAAGPAASHYVLGWLPRWIRLASARAGGGQRGAAGPAVARLVLGAGGMDPRRGMRSVRRDAVPHLRRAVIRPPAARPPPPPPLGNTAGHGRRCPAPGAAVDRLVQRLARRRGPGGRGRGAGHAGYEVLVPDGRMLRADLDHDRAAGRSAGPAAQLLGVLGPFAVNGIPIVGLEPRCTAVLRSDLLDLFPEDPRAWPSPGRRVPSPSCSPLLRPSGPGDAVDATGSGRHRRFGPAALPPARRDRLRAGPGLLAEAGATFSTLAGCCGLAG